MPATKNWVFPLFVTDGVLRPLQLVFLHPMCLEKESSMVFCVTHSNRMTRSIQCSSHLPVKRYSRKGLNCCFFLQFFYQTFCSVLVLYMIVKCNKSMKGQSNIKLFGRNAQQGRNRIVKCFISAARSYQNKLKNK